jgi:hypothetical protein
MDAGRGGRTMPGMSTPTVIESPLRLESVTADPFVADLERPVSEADLHLIAVATTPRRRIYD